MKNIKCTSNCRLTLIVFAVFLIGLISCKKDWLDKKTDIKLTTPETLKDFQALMDNTGIMNTGSPAAGEMASDGHYMTDANFNSRVGVDKNSYIWTNTPPVEGYIDWNNPYKTVFYCNLVLDGLDKIQNNKSSFERLEFNNIKGQALFQRSKSFYELSQIFAPPFSADLGSSNLGIPLRLNSDANEKTVRANVKESYDQIIGDLTKAKDLLPRNSTVKTRASKIGAYALLARIYLSIENYTSAKLFADSCLQNYNELLDYNTLDSNSATPIPLLNKEIIFYSTMYSTSTLGSRLLIDPQQKALYSPNDLRRVVFFGTGSGGSITFKGSYQRSVSVQFNGLATDEIYLIRAECAAREGNIFEAMSDLNTLMRMRWNKKVSFPLFTAASAEDALRKILAERKKELLLRGVRWSDLRRLNRDDRFKITLTRTVSGNTYTLEPNSYKYTFPLGLDVLRLTAIPQNIGW